MSNSIERSAVSSRFRALGLLAALFMSPTYAALASTESFSVPDDVALRIRLDDTLTGIDSQIGDPFSATVVDKGDYHGGAGGLGTTAFHGRQKITLNSGQEMLIRITGR